jgi:hypothetical protein
MTPLTHSLARSLVGWLADRRMWRVWTWTESSEGRPHGDSRPVSSPLDIHLELTTEVEARAGGSE